MNQNANIDDIMSSIRTGVESESGKAPSGSADLLEQAAQEATAADAAAEGGEDDVLELTPAEMATPAAADPATPAEGVADVLGVATLSGADEAADEFDKLLAEIGEEKKSRAAAVEAQKEALLADIEPLGTPEPAPAEIAPEALAETMPVEAAPALEEAPAFQAAPAAALSAEGAKTVGMIEGENGAMNLVLPAEVLIQALRPMVQQWLQQNLAPITEKLVQAEIAKLNS